jgi:hypothetical protein
MSAAHRFTCYPVGDACIAVRAQTQGKIERWHQTMKNRVLLENYYLLGDLERQIGGDYRGLRRLLQQPALQREFKQRYARRCLLRTGQSHSKGKGENQETNNPPTPLATSKKSCIINHTNEPEPPKLKPL